MRHVLKAAISLLTVISLLVSGCGIELFRTVSRLQTAGSPLNVLPSWPVSAKVGLGGASVLLSSVLKGGNGIPIATQSDNTYALNPASQSIPPRGIGNNLNVDAQNGIPIPPQSIPDISIHNQNLANKSLQLPLALIDSGIPKPLGGGDFSLSDLVDTAGPTDVLPRDATFSFDVTGLNGILVNLPDSLIRQAQYGASSSFTIASNFTIAGPEAGNVVLTMSNLKIQSAAVSGGGVAQLFAAITANQFSDNNGVWRVSHPTVTLPASGSFKADLDPTQPLGSGILVQFTLTGRIPAGTHLKNLSTKTASQTLTLTAGADVNITGVDEADRPLPSASQSFDVPIPSGQGITAIANIAVGTGSIQLGLNNGLGLNVRLGLSFVGMTKGGATFAPPAVLATASTNATASIDLSGVVIQGTHITVNITSTALDTRNPLLPGPPTGFAALPSGANVSGTVKVGALSFNGASVAITRSVPISTQSQPVSLPPDLQKLKVGLSSISIEIDLFNQSQLPGNIQLDLIGNLPGSASIPLQFKNPNQTFPLIAAAGPGLTGISPVLVTDQNSNISTILNSGATSLSFGGQVTIDTQGQLKPLTWADQVSGQVAVSVPLTLTFPTLGSNGVAPYNVQPPSPLGFDATTKGYLAQGAVEDFGIVFVVNNGFHIPLDVNLLFSKQADPYSDPAPMVKALHLGDGTAPVSSIIELQKNEIQILKDCQLIGFQITSTGTKAPITLRSTDRLSIQLVGLIKLRVSSKVIQQATGGSK